MITHPTSTKNVTGQTRSYWQTSTLSSQHVPSRSLTISPCSTQRLSEVEKDTGEKEGEKRREASTLVERFQKPWLRPTSTFTPAPELGRPPGGSSPVIHFFRDQETGARWIGKLGQVPLRDKEVLDMARRLPGFLGVYADEILEKLGLAIYQLLGTEVPDSALSYQQVTMEAMHPDMLLAMQLNAEDEGRAFELPRSPRMHYLCRYVDDFQPLDPDFVQEYILKAKSSGKEYVKIHTNDGELLPLMGLGKMLAAADFVYDLDCLGDRCGNAGYVIREDAATGKRYTQLIKIDAGYAFSYSDLRTDQRHNPRDRQIRVAPNQLRLQFADLAPADQKEFALAAKRILATPYEEFAQLFAKTEEMHEGLSFEHWLELLNGLIARKSLFLKAFAAETDRKIIEEIEAAQAKVAKKLEHTEEVSAQAVEELLEQEKQEAQALAELRVKLAVVDVKESEPKQIGECKTFQLPSTNTHFVGREKALAAVVKQLTQTNSSVIGQNISGIGGVGKTQLALHYAQAAANGAAIAGKHLGYDYVVWLNAELFLEGQFQAMAKVWTGEHLKGDEAVEAVYRFLRGKRTLLVFDNAENAHAIARFLPPAQYSSPAHFLITSRNPQWGKIPTIQLGGFSLDEAQEYVEYHLGPQSKEAVKKLAELLGGLPLAMSQAVSYIKAGHSTLQGFEEQFYLNQANLLSHELLEEEAHPKTVGTTLTLCLAQAKVKNPLVEKLLGMIAYFAAEGIKMELVQEGLGVSREEVEKALDVLESYSLVSQGNGELQVHRLVQEVMRHRHKFLKEPLSHWNKIIDLLNNVVFDDDTKIQEMRQCSHAIAHVKQVGGLSNKLVLNQDQELVLGKLLKIAGLHQWTMGNHEAARTFQEQVLKIIVCNYGPNHPEVAKTLSNLGTAYGHLGNDHKKKELLERALIIEEQHYGTDHPETAKTLMNLAVAYGDLGDARRQKELLERTLVINERHYGLDHPEVAKTLVNLGIAYGNLGKPIEKKEVLKRALVINERYYGVNHIEVATTLVNLANTYSDLGNPHKKKELLKRALNIDEIHYGADHPTVALSLGNLGIAYGELGNVSKKKDILERVLVIFEQHYGRDHALVAKTLVNLGTAYGDLGDVTKMHQLLERALIINEQHYGPSHLEVAITLYNLSKIESDLDKKQALLERTLVIFEQHYDSDHVMVANTLNNLALVCGKLGDTLRKKALLERALIINKNLYGTDHPQVALTLFNLAQTCIALKQTAEAKQFAQESYLIYKDNYGENDGDTQDANDLIFICEEMGSEEI